MASPFPLPLVVSVSKSQWLLLQGPCVLCVLLLLQAVALIIALIFEKKVCFSRHHIDRKSTRLNSSH